MSENKKLTEEQQKQIRKILFKGKLALLGIGAKFSFGLFFANAIAIVIGSQILKDVDPEMISGYGSVAFIVNLIFMVTYLDRQLKANADIVTKKIQEVLKDDQQS